MFPVGDFNFVVAGIATFAATVGYACKRQLGATLYDLLLSFAHSGWWEMPNQFCDALDLDLSLHTIRSFNKFKKQHPPSLRRRLIRTLLQPLKIRTSPYYQAKKRWRGRSQTMGSMRTTWGFYYYYFCHSVSSNFTLIINRRNLDIQKSVSMVQVITI